MTAIDRSPLNADLMRDPKVEFVQGDAFSFNPLDTAECGGGGQCVDWMVCDVIAEPLRVPQLLEAWYCSCACVRACVCACVRVCILVSADNCVNSSIVFALKQA